jgi:putative ABC transport system permease protein
VLSHGLWTRHFGASRDALNATLCLNGRTFRIVGVAPASFHGTTLGLLSDLWVPAAHERAIRSDQIRGSRGVGEDPRPYAYFPLRQGAARAMTVVARVSGGDPATYLRDIGDTIRRLDPVVPLYDVTTMAERVAMSMAPTTGGASALGIVGVVALALTALGLYSVVGQTVAHRRYEIGVRWALGAQDRDVARLVIAHAMGLVILGLTAGLAAGLGSARLLQRLLYGVDPADPVAFGGAPLVLVAVCVLAAWVPTWRALRINAAAALRCE